MTKELAKETWRRCLRLIRNGSGSQRILCPVRSFDIDVKAGEFDDLESEAFINKCLEQDQIFYGMWNGHYELPAKDVFVNAISSTDISDAAIDEIAELLSEASAITDYPSEPDCDSAPSNSQKGTRSSKAESSSEHEEKLDRWSPKDIEHDIREYGGIIGQDAAMRAAATIFYNHIEGRPSVSLFMAPTGSGKTEIWRAMQREFGDVNIAIHDASTLTPEGWKGDNKISTIFKNIKPDRRDHIVLVLDEFDKLLEPKGGSVENYADLLQNNLLKLCDHDKLFFGSSGMGEELTVDASNVSIVFLGAFEKLLKKKSRDTGSLGFGAQLRYDCDYSNTEITTEDLIKYGGMREELAGRIQKIVCMEPLSIDVMKRIGQNEVKKIAKQMRREINIDPGTLEMLARTAMQKNLGARGLRAKINNMLDDMIYENPEAKSYMIICETGADEEQAHCA